MVSAVIIRLVQEICSCYFHKCRPYFPGRVQCIRQNLGVPESRFHHSKAQLDGVQLRAVRRQVNKHHSSRITKPLDPASPMDFGVVAHQDQVECWVPVHAGELNNMVSLNLHHTSTKLLTKLCFKKCSSFFQLKVLSRKVTTRTPLQPMVGKIMYRWAFWRMIKQ